MDCTLVGYFGPRCDRPYVVDRTLRCIADNRVVNFCLPEVTDPVRLIGLLRCIADYIFTGQFL